MQYRTRRLLLIILFLSAGAAPVIAQPTFTFNKITDDGVQVPGQGATFFSNLHAPSVSGDQVLFRGFYNGFITSGVYIKNGTGALALVFDDNTTMPGFGLPMTDFGERGDVNAAGVAVIRAQGSDGVTDGIYTGTGGGAPVVVADENTTVPGLGVGFGRFLNPVSIDADGQVLLVGTPNNNNNAFVLYQHDGTALSRLAGNGDAIAGKTETLTGITNHVFLRNGNTAFLGTNTASSSSGQGIYRIIGGVITPLVDQDTSVPGGGNIQSFSNMSFDGDNVVFLAFDTTGKLGIYVFKDGTLTLIANTSTPVPGTSDPFLFFGSPAIDGDRVVFHGISSANNLQGLFYYRISDQTFVKLVDENDQLGGLGIRNNGGLSMHPNGLSGDKVGFLASFDDQSQAVYTATIDDNLPTGPRVSVDLGVGKAGDQIRIAVRLTNEIGPAVGGLQMAVVTQNIGEAQFVGIEDHTGIAGFTMEVNELTPGTVNFVMYSNSHATIAPDAEPVRLATLVYEISAGAVLGSTNSLDIQGLLVGDENGVAVDAAAENGAIHVNIVGDLNLSGTVNVLDVIKLSRIVIGLDPTPDPSSAAFKIADGNNDGVLDVVDILFHINTVLGLPNPPSGKHLADGTVTVSLADAIFSGDGRHFIPITMEGALPVGGLQARLRFDPSALRIDTPRPADGLSGIELVSRVSSEEGLIHLVMFRTDAETGLPADGRAVVLLPVAVIGDGRPELLIDDVKAASTQAQRIQTITGRDAVAITAGKTGVPALFNLTGNAPNPFNPSTTISYEVPQPAHVRLVVYNLLGQEVIRLVNQVQPAGRYTAVWDARNAQGLPVSSGVYMYRLTSETGYSKTKRMTLLK